MVNFSVVTEGQQVASLVRENAEVMQKVRDAFERKEFELETGRFQLFKPSKKEPVYRLTNTLQVTTNRVAEAGKIIDRAIKAGANGVDQLQFQLKDPSIFRDEAITLATKKAMQDGQTLAKAAGQSVSKILYLSLDGADPTPFQMRGSPVLMMSQTPIEPGQVDIRATVNLIYELGSL